MALDLSGFRDPKLGRELIDCINALAPAAVQRCGGQVNLMEVCGTHTVTIARNGFRSILPPGVNLVSGPGCPVCVTANRDIDTVIALARIPGTIITTFGDMTRVPGSSSSLNQEKAAGADIRIVYSPLDALKVAQENPERQVVFVGVGFETTTPLIAATVTMVLGTLIAFPLAWLVGRTNLFGKKFFRSLFVLTYMVPPYVGAMAWLRLLNPNVGTMNQFFRMIFGLGDTPGPLNIYTLGGLIWVLTTFYYPYAFITISRAMEKMDPSLE